MFPLQFGIVKAEVMEFFFFGPGSGGGGSGGGEKDGTGCKLRSRASSLEPNCNGLGGDLQLT